MVFQLTSLAIPASFFFCQVLCAHAKTKFVANDVVLFVFWPAALAICARMLYLSLGCNANARQTHVLAGTTLDIVTDLVLPRMNSFKNVDLKKSTKNEKHFGRKFKSKKFFWGKNTLAQTSNLDFYMERTS